MNTLVARALDAGLADRVFDERQLGDILGGGNARRYALVNRALKDGSLIRLRRGAYLLGQRYHNEMPHPFAIAQALLPGSYVSFETALAYHGWIPEAALTTASVSPGRKTIVQETPFFGAFAFHPLAIHDYQFLTSVDREKTGKRAAFIAQPLRALIDLVALRKEPWSGLDWLTVSMRIDESLVLSLRRKDFAKLRPVYKHKAVNAFLHSLEAAVFGLRNTVRGGMADD